MLPDRLRRISAIALVAILTAVPVAAQQTPLDITGVEVLGGGLMRISYRSGQEAKHVDLPADVLAQLVRQMDGAPPGPVGSGPSDVSSSRGADEVQPRQIGTARMHSRIADQDFNVTIIADSLVNIHYRSGGADHMVSLPPDIFALVDRTHRSLSGRSLASEAELYFDPSAGTLYVGFMRGFDYRLILAIVALIIGVLVAILVRISVWRVRRERDELLASRRNMARIRESERSHLASELHDGPIQDLQRILRTYVGELSQLTTEEQKAKLAEIEIDLRDVAGNLRGICSDLKPPVLVHFGLARAAEAYVRDFQSRHPDSGVELDVGPDPERLSMEIRLVLYRILQEALTNVEKHASASTVRVELRRDGEMVVLSVEDDGVGFRVPSRLMKFEQSGHFGLSGMLQRVQAVGGRLDVSSRPGGGTTISALVSYVKEPVKHTPEMEAEKSR